MSEASGCMQVHPARHSAGGLPPVFEGLHVEDVQMCSEVGAGPPPSSDAESSQAWVPVRLAKPRQPHAAPLPAVVLLHATGQGKDSVAARQAQFARRGFVAVAVDCRYHGDRGQGGDGCRDAYQEALVRRAGRGGRRVLRRVFSLSWFVPCFLGLGAGLVCNSPIGGSGLPETVGGRGSRPWAWILPSAGFMPARCLTPCLAACAQGVARQWRAPLPAGQRLGPAAPAGLAGGKVGGPSGAQGGHGKEGGPASSHMPFPARSLPLAQFCCRVRPGCDWLLHLASPPAVPSLGCRPDVDAGRIGMTGVSLGGMHTWLAAAADERVAVAAPMIGVQFFGCEEKKGIQGATLACSQSSTLARLAAAQHHRVTWPAFHAGGRCRTTLSTAG